MLHNVTFSSFVVESSRTKLEIFIIHYDQFRHSTERSSFLKNVSLTQVLTCRRIVAKDVCAVYPHRLSLSLFPTVLC